MGCRRGSGDPSGLWGRGVGYRWGRDMLKRPWLVHLGLFMDRRLAVTQCFEFGSVGRFCFMEEVPDG